MPNRLIVYNPYNIKIPHEELDFFKDERTVIMTSEIEEEGKYYVVIGSCDPLTRNVVVSGSVTAVNSYGHLPARLYGLYPFLRWILGIYIILLVVWIVRCCIYRRELMSVHLMIFLVLFLSVIDLILRQLNLSHFNTSGEYSYSLTLVSLFASALNSTVSLCLTIAIAKGFFFPFALISRLGVSRATLDGELWKILTLGIISFAFTLWDGITSTFYQSTDLNLWQLIPSIIVNVTIYSWILSSLLNTIEELENRKQTGKLRVFIQLRNVIVIAVVLSTLYNIAFTYLIMKEIISSWWKYQWFFNDGVWSVFYLGITICIMVLLQELCNE